MPTPPLRFMMCDNCFKQGLPCDSHGCSTIIYTQGNCFLLALALSEQNDWAIHAPCDALGGPIIADHFWVVDETGMSWDVRGQQTCSHMLSTWGFDYSTELQDIDIERYMRWHENDDSFEQEAHHAQMVAELLVSDKRLSPTKARLNV